MVHFTKTCVVTSCEIKAFFHVCVLCIQLTAQAWTHKKHCKNMLAMPIANTKPALLLCDVTTEVHNEAQKVYFVNIINL